MDTKELTCIGCPLGCAITVELDGSEVKSVRGNTCKRGELYAKKEVTAPTRIVTSTVAVSGGVSQVVSVKTASDIPKKLIFECMKEISKAKIKAPVEIGEIIIRDVAGTGVNVVATKSVAV